MKLFGFLTESKSSVTSYVLKAAALSFLSALVISLLLRLVLGSSKTENAPLAQSVITLGPYLALILMALAAPLIETLFLGCVITLMKWKRASFWMTVFIASFLAAIVHSLASLAWGVAIFFPFMIFSIAFSVWGRERWLKGYFVSATIHALHNLPSAILIFFQLR